MMLRVFLSLPEVAHMLALMGAHDSKNCPRCDAIETQLVWSMREFRNHNGGEGGAPPLTSEQRREAPTISSLDDLPF